MKWYNFVLATIFLVISGVNMAMDETTMGIWFMGLSIVNFIFYLDYKFSDKLDEIKKKMDSK